MIKVGITGGIGSGKSVVSDLLSIMGVPVYIADNESKRLTLVDTEIREALITRLGSEIYSVDGSLNKALLASYIFSDKRHLQWVNGVIHPVVLKDFRSWAKLQTSAIVAIESAILFESGFDGSVDTVVSVASPLDIRIDRVRKRDGLSDEQIQQRMNNQWPDEEKCRRSDFVVVNDDGNALIPQIEHVVKTLKSRCFL